MSSKYNQHFAVPKRLMQKKMIPIGQASNMTYKPSIKTKGVYEEQ
jgi:hypothetical protein